MKIEEMSSEDFIGHLFYNVLGGIHANEEIDARLGIIDMIEDMKSKPKRPVRMTIDEAIFKIEDYVGGNIEEVKDIDRMGFTVFLRSILAEINEGE